MRNNGAEIALGFVAEEYFPGFEDGTDMYGVAARANAHRKPLGEYAGFDGSRGEFANARDVEDAAIAAIDARGTDTFEDLDEDVAALAELFDENEPEDVDPMPIETAFCELDGADDQGMAPIDSDETIIASSYTGAAARALDRFERDGRLTIGSRLAVLFVDGEVFARRYTFHVHRAWKRHRPTQYRPREMFPLELFRLVIASS